MEYHFQSYSVRFLDILGQKSSRWFVVLLLAVGLEYRHGLVSSYCSRSNLRMDSFFQRLSYLRWIFFGTNRIRSKFIGQVINVFRRKGNL